MKWNLEKRKKRKTFKQNVRSKNEEKIKVGDKINLSRKTRNGWMNEKYLKNKWRKVRMNLEKKWSQKERRNKREKKEEIKWKRNKRKK